MARRLFRKKRPQQSRSLAVFLIAVLCLGAGYALWFTDSTRQRQTAEISVPVATDAGQPVRLPSGFGNAFIDRPSMRLGTPIENDRRSENISAAKPVIDPDVTELPPTPALPAGNGTSGPSRAPQGAIPGADGGAGAPRPEPAAEPAGPTAAPTAVQPAASRSDANAQNGEQVRTAGTAPTAAPESPSSALAVEPAAGPAAAPPAEPVEPTTLASLSQPPTPSPASDAARATDITEPVPRPVPRARQALPISNDEDPIDARTQDPPPSARDDALAIVAAPLRPVVLPPALEDDEPLVAEQQPGAQSLDAEDELPPATSRNVARSLMTTAIRDREPARALGDTVSLREIDRSQLYYFTELTGLMGRKVEHRWMYRGRVEGTMRFQVASNRWRASSRKTILPHQKGEWRVIVVDEGGRTLGSSRFVVE